MRSWTAIAIAAAAVMAADLAAASGAVSVYNISDPTYGTCRLMGVSASTDNFKYYASVSSKDFALNDACARCITVTRADDSSKTTSAYVLDVCDGCASGTLQLSPDSMAALELDTTDTSTKVSYEFDTCPTSLMSGDIKACLMDGASATYVPLQFYNSQKVISGATIDGVTATSSSSTFLYSANSGSSSSTWYSSVEFSVTSDDGETLNSTFAFTSKTGCATSDVQFNSASTADGVDGSTSTSSGSSNGAIIGGICGGAGVLLIIVGSVILVRRRNRASKDAQDPENDVENQYLSPTTKPKAAAAGASTFRSDHSGHDDHQPPASPTVDYAESFSPAASSKAPSSHLSDTSSHVSSPAPAAAVPAAVVAASIAVDSPVSSALSDHSSVVSAPYSHNSSVERTPSPEPVYVAPTYSYSSNMVTSPRRSNMKAAPTLSAPVVPRQTSGTSFQQYDEDVEEERSSFDIDDMRESEARATSTDNMRRTGSFAPYSAADPYANTVTSPQSNVRATSLRRPSAKQNSMRTSGRDSGRYNNGSVISNADSYASAAPRQTNQSILSNSTGVQSGRSNPPPAPDNYSFSARPSGLTEIDTMTDSVRDSYASVPALQQNTDLSSSQRSIGSLRESGGYSRDSLNILGYPYSKKSGRHHNTTG
ncbi:hypothetical protein PHYPSEUDO_012467 [Phytophthora pseudosyringae]|uniref:Expansin-like EG45 domain-containing protein n=1 Tax=Phytophthora pseudosyringae TaxID=221518 RepID=A0A8T1WIZ2_9STRA|nr:hypothetical protein PHYPSEUDO_012467 [Phytophthora pseudosyringae]